MPHDASLCAWWHPRTMLKNNQVVAFPAVALEDLVGLQKHLAKLYMAKMSAHLQVDPAAAATKLLSDLKIWLCAMTWKYVWVPILPLLSGLPDGNSARRSISKERRRGTVLQWARADLFSTDSRQVCDWDLCEGVVSCCSLLIALDPHRSKTILAQMLSQPSSPAIRLDLASLAIPSAIHRRNNDQSGGRRVRQIQNRSARRARHDQ